MNELFTEITQGNGDLTLSSDQSQSFKAFDGKYIIILSASNYESLAFVARGEGRTFTKALEVAIHNLTHLLPKKFKVKEIKLDIVNKMNKVNTNGEKFHLTKDSISYNRGLDGLAFGEDQKTIFLPSEVADFAIIRRGKVNINNAFKALRRHLPTTYSDFFKPFDSNNLVDLYKVRTKTFYYSKEQGYLKLFRGHRRYNELSSDTLWNAITLTKDNYFKNCLMRSGKFIYSFLPHLNKRERRYNILRHAGTTYSMIETYELMPDNELLQEINKALRFLVKKIKPLEVNGQQVKVVVERDVQKVGGNALAIVAFAKYTQVTGDKQYVPLMKDLANWIKEIQDDSGRFTVHKQGYSDGRKYDFVSHYYPGEAILSMARLYQIDKDETWLDVAEKAAHYLIEVRDKNDTIDTIAHDHWLLYALNDLYRERPKDIYLKHSFFIAEAIMKRQINEDNAKRKELIGGYFTKSGNEPSSTPVACRSEGLSAAYNLAMDYGYDEIAKKMYKAIAEGIKFQLQMQLRPESVFHYRRKSLCLGAVQGGLKSLGLRNDFTQHNISSFIAYYNILSK